MNRARVLGIVLGLLVAGCQRSGQPDAAAAPTPPAASPGSGVIAADPAQSSQLRVAAIEVAEVHADEVVAPGRVIANPNRIGRVLLPAPGRVAEVLATLGSAVERGQPVLSIESPDADAAIAAFAQAEAAERQATSALKKAETDAARTRDLYELRAIPEKDVHAAQNDLAQAQGALEAARAGREQAARKLDLLGLKPAGGRQRILVRAPLNGKVLEVNVAPGEYRTDTAASLMTIADLDTVWVASDVAESSVGLIRVNDPVTITLLAYPGERLSGRVARMADTLDPQTRTLKVYVELPNPHGRLRPEMFATVRHVGAAVSLPVLPAGALVREYGRSIVFVERAPGRYERRQVTVGPPVGEGYAVLDGVGAGQRVVVDGAMLLKDR